jgi:hypothetical protein
MLQTEKFVFWHETDLVATPPPHQVIAATKTGSSEPNNTLWTKFWTFIPLKLSSTS